jgi:hypothetical protein
MSKISYLSANVTTADTFAQWLVRTNQIVYDMGTVVLTAGSVAQPNTTNGAQTTGNTHLEGILSANTLTVVGSMRGGTVSAPSNMTVTSNVVFTSSDVLRVANTVALFNSNTTSTFTKDFSVLASGHTATFAVTTWSANATTASFTGGALNLNTSQVTVGQNTTNTLTVNSTTTGTGPVTLTNAVTLSTAVDAINLGTTQTTGAFNVGSTTGTAAINLGRSTQTQTVNIATGNTATGQTKTINVGAGGSNGSIHNINIGTGGVAGSNTNIVIGSTNSLTDIINDARLTGRLIIGTQTNKATVQYTTNTAITYTIPHTGANADFVMTTGNQTIAGNKTLSGSTTYTGTLTGSALVMDIGSGQLYKAANGNIGVGTTAPAAAVHVASGDIHMTGGNRRFVVTSNNSLSIGANNLDALTVLASGNVGVGVATPTESLHVSGKVRIGTQATTTTDAVRADRLISTGDGLLGGGNLTADRTLTVDSTVVRTPRLVATGDGLLGGGNLTADRTLTVDSTVVRTPRLVATGDGLLGGGNLTADRTLTVDSTVVRTTRTLTAGDGIAGGGTLAANRSFAVDATVVRTSGDQTIAGTKTFSSPTTFSSNTTFGLDATFNGPARFNQSVFVEGNLLVSGNSTLTTSEADINNLVVLNSLSMFTGATVATNFIPAAGGLLTLGSTLQPWGTVFTGTVTLGSAGTTTTSAVRADRTLQLSAGTNISITGAGTAAQNLTANRAWTIAAANTDLATTANTTTRTVTSSTGTNVVLVTANSTQAGVMTSADRIKIDGIESGAQVNLATNLGTVADTVSRTVTSSTGASVTLPSATALLAGVMTSADRTKLDGIAAGAQVNVPTNLSIGSSTGTEVRVDSSTGTNVTLPVASSTLAGIVTNAAQTIAGAKTFSSTIVGSVSGNAGTSTTLQTARTITVGNTAKTFNGSANVAWSLSEIGINDSVLTLSTSGIATGSQSWSSNQGSTATFNVNVPGTNIAQGTRTTNTVPITSSTGTSATLGAATTLLAGVMTADDKVKLDGIAAGAQVNVPTNLSIGSSTGTAVRIDSSTGTNATLPVASATLAGIVTNAAQTIAGAKTFSSTIVGSVSGNAGTATTLQTARTLWGQTFNGSANVVGDLTSVGNVTGLGAITLAAGSGNHNVTLSPSGTGFVQITKDMYGPLFHATTGVGGVMYSSIGISSSSMVEISAPSAVFSGALVVSSGGIAVTGTSTVTGKLNTNDRITVTSGGVAVTGPSNVTGTLEVSSALTVLSGGISVTGNITVGTQTNRATIAYTTNTARTYTIPDAGANANFVMTAGNQTITGTKTFDGTITGTAVTQSNTDTTSGRLLKLGDYGLGSASIAIGSETDLNNVWRAGWYHWISSSVPVNAPTTFGVMMVMARNASNDVQQMIIISGQIRTRSLANSIWSQWRINYNTHNILGTVSEASGIPTGAIIERGSNSNGEFVRYADGTQICSRVLSSNVACDVSLAIGGFRSADITWVFPAQFVTGTSPVTTSTTGNSSWNIAIESVSDSSVVYRHRTVTSSTSVTRVAHLVAVGRWF